MFSKRCLSVVGEPIFLAVMKFRSAVVVGVVLSLVSPLVCGHEREVQTDRESPRLMALPKEEDSFHFLIFGDRTGGPAEGIKVLAQAVKDSNLLDPDLVMTVGDLIQGYNSQKDWEAQMTEYRGTMDGLRMPWFPVAGNHDVFWRGEGRPVTEHEVNYEKHFGPLWYWFEHKKCGFLVLFSDEGDLKEPEKARNFSDPAQQKFSPRQLEWLRGSLTKMKDLRHVFVFMHHPRWALDVYPGSNWNEVHGLLKDAGNVTACFAGHIHRLRYDGERDGIEYFALAATGGHIPGNHPGMGFLHHYNLVSVRPEGIRVSTLPVGGVMDPKDFTPERLRDMDLAARMEVVSVTGPLRLAEDGSGAGAHEVEVRNPRGRALDVTRAVVAGEGWRFGPDHGHAKVEPGAVHRFRFEWTRSPSEAGLAVESPQWVVDVDYLDEKARVTLPQRRVPVKVGFGPLAAELFLPVDPPVSLTVKGGGAGVAVDDGLFELGDGPFTLEAWMKPEVLQDDAGVIAKTEGSEYGLHLQQGRVAFLAHLGGDYVVVRSTDALAVGEWSHVAGVFDGKAVRLFVNGREVAMKPGEGARKRNGLPLFIGADPNGRSEPTRPFSGRLDEIRLSRVARYAEVFEPVRRHEPDEQTVLLFHADRLVNGVLPDHSASQAHGVMTGGVTVAAE
jgi:hypothetical protein